jgi:hypothetical protein
MLDFFVNYAPNRMEWNGSGEIPDPVLQRGCCTNADMFKGTNADLFKGTNADTVFKRTNAENL